MPKSKPVSETPAHPEMAKCGNCWRPFVDHTTYRQECPPGFGAIPYSKFKPTGQTFVPRPDNG